MAAQKKQRKLLTDKQKKKIIALRSEGMSIRDIAAQIGVSYYAAQSTLKKSDESVNRKISEKKEQNTRDVLEYLDARRDKLQDVLDLGFNALSDPNKYERASLQSVATMMGILIDKYTQLAQIKAASGGGNELLQSLLDLEKRRSNDGD